MTPNELYLAVRAWFVLAARVTALGAAEIIQADQAGPRPTPPYATIKVNTFDQMIGHDEEIVNASAQLVTRGNRRATVSVNTFGEDAAAWLSRSVALLRHRSVKAILATQNVAVVPIGGANNLTHQVGDRMEPRFQRDFSIYYGQVSDPEQLLELATVQAEQSFSGELTITDTIPL